jgi:hypothetical protein
MQVAVVASVFIGELEKRTFDYQVPPKPVVFTLDSAHL